LWIANRTASRAQVLAESLRRCGIHSSGDCPEVNWSGFDKIEDLLPGLDVLINTVSAGCPVGSAQVARLRAGAVLAESKYGAKADLADLAGGRIYVDGKAMLFGQFVEAAEAVHSILGVPEKAHLQAVRSPEVGR
jgi:shikimate 5-dehydrogenase